MKHPAHTAHEFATTLETMLHLLTESKNDEKAALIKLVKQCKETLKRYREQVTQQAIEKQYAQQMFCDALTFEFSTNADFSESYTREYVAMISDMEIIKTIVYAERKLQNMGDEYLFARVTITDTDPEV